MNAGTVVEDSGAFSAINTRVAEDSIAPHPIPAICFCADLVAVFRGRSRPTSGLEPTA